MNTRAVNDSIQAVWGEAADQACVVHIVDSEGNLVAEKAIASVVYQRGDQLLAPQDPFQTQESKLIIKIQE